MSEETKYTDPTGLDKINYNQSDVSPEVKKHAKNVRTKMFGRHVRESIARAIEFIDLVAGNALNFAKKAFDKSEDTENRLDNQISELTEDSELIDFRYSKALKKTFTVAKNRGDYWDEEFEKLDQYKKRIYVKNGDDITEQFINLINNQEIYHIILPQGKTLYLKNNEKIILDRAITIDFNDCNIIVDTDVDRVFEIGFGGEDDYRSRVKLLNYQFTSKGAEKAPGTFIFVKFGVNTELDGSFNRCIASHSLFWNFGGYGTKITGEARHNISPRAVYYSHSSTNEIFSFDIKNELDISQHTGIGVETEGGAGYFKGVIQGCTEGGYLYNGKNIAMGIQISCHFENNTKFNAQIGTDESNEGYSKNTGQHSFNNSLFLSGWGKNVLYGSYQTIVFDSCMSMYRRGSNKAIEPLSSETIGANINLNASYSVTYDTPKTGNIISDTDFNKTTRMRSIFLYDQFSKISAAFRIGIRPENTTTDVVTITKDSVLPEHNKTMLGGDSNVFKNITTSALHLVASDGSIYAITVDSTGKMYTTKVK